jgi:aspartyl-tRNA(Asn)/glutamyl-tRNA(Gln) amidotransferase subunit C
MKVTEKDVRHVAALAHLELTPEEGARLVKDLGATLAYIDKLNELDTANVPPTAQVELPRGETLRTHPLRNDQARPSLPRQEALGNAAETGAVDGQPAFFKVPKVIER